MKLEVKNLVKKFKSFTAVKNINFNINDGQTLGVLGPNGCGKTTTIGMLLGLIKPSNGEILIDDERGKEVKRDKAIDEKKYTEIVPEFKDTYFEEVYNRLKKRFKLGRVRILLKEPRSTLSWHRDPEPRLHIPIITNPGCKMVIEDVAKHMPADGSVTITNNLKYHNFFNGGEQDRIHLVACVLENPFKKIN